MIQKITFGSPFPTEAVVVPVEEGSLSRFTLRETEHGRLFSCPLAKTDAVYGLGETMRGINKRGGRYVSFNTDDMRHRADMPSLYGSHNFIIVDGTEPFGAFFDTPTCVTFEIDYRKSGKLDVLCEQDVTLYLIDGESAYDVTRQFLQIIGQSFIPPLWAFGYGQSRWGYKTKKDYDGVVAGYRKAQIPLDYICMDIDYMDRYIDFTLNPKHFADLKEYARQMKEQGVRLVPIIDAGVKIEPGNETYEEGVKNGYFCVNEDGNPFSAAVWPGMTHFPDFPQPKAREWFGNEYHKLTELGIEGFWNDMNEPAIFHSEYSSSADYAKDKKFRESDYKRFFHTVDGKRIRHYDVHNLYGYMMTRAASEQLDKLLDKRFLLFSRSSYVGSHRYGGIWTGDNRSCWAHLRQIVYQLPSLNMCGILYTGSDTGGFSGNTTRELLIRWLAVSAFTPLMRNHSMIATRRQECYRFSDVQEFKQIIDFRYRFLPYLYSEYVKCALRRDMLFKPLAFVYGEKAKHIEDQLLVGDSVMMTPILEKGKTTRTVFLPEEMTMVRYDGSFHCATVPEGTMEISVPLDEIVFFIRKGKLVPVGKGGNNTSEIDLSDVTLLGDGTEYEQYLDDGFTKQCTLDDVRVLKK
ncbi:MAG: alpha-glucosidase [Clostridia bacterium]|nr:alpha-glucosidase [Clostridia bacterium]